MALRFGGSLLLSGDTALPQHADLWLLNSHVAAVFCPHAAMLRILPALMCLDQPQSLVPSTAFAARCGGKGFLQGSGL